MTASNSAAAMPRDFAALLELEPHGADTFVGLSPPYDWGRIFGGQVIAQALSAAAATVHVNLELALTPDHHADVLWGAIFEGPHTWPVRPVGEAYAERDGPDVVLVSALAGAIWEAREGLSVDAAFRFVHEEVREEPLRLYEVRAGLTWSFTL